VDERSDRGPIRQRGSDALPERLLLRRLPTVSLDAEDVRALRALLFAAFQPGEEAFTEDDWQHTIGGTHVLLDLDGRLVAHASIIERVLHAGAMPLQTGYVEGVAVEPGRQGRGLGTRVMREVGALIRERYPLGALATGSHHFYERLGWRTWLGPTGVRIGEGLRATPDANGAILVLETPTSPPLDLGAPLSCDWRPGDVW
jgi:aminoglycoside 2'-N-acetyltransferase I